MIKCEATLLGLSLSFENLRILSQIQGTCSTWTPSAMPRTSLSSATRARTYRKRTSLPKHPGMMRSKPWRCICRSAWWCQNWSLFFAWQRGAGHRVNNAMVASPANIALQPGPTGELQPIWLASCFHILACDHFSSSIFLMTPWPGMSRSFRGLRSQIRFQVHVYAMGASQLHETVLGEVFVPSLVPFAARWMVGHGLTKWPWESHSHSLSPRRSWDPWTKNKVQIVWRPSSNLIREFIPNPTLIPIWRFPRMGVPLNHPNFSGIFPCKPSILEYPHSWKPPYLGINTSKPNFHLEIPWGHLRHCACPVPSFVARSLGS